MLAACFLRSRRTMRNEKRFVYILRSDRTPARHYVGITSDVATRVEWHNAGQNEHTVRERPWSVVVALEFPTQLAAYRFERYLNRVRAARSRNGISASAHVPRVKTRHRENVDERLPPRPAFRSPSPSFGWGRPSAWPYSESPEKDVSRKPPRSGRSRHSHRASRTHLEQCWIL